METTALRVQVTYRRPSLGRISASLEYSSPLFPPPKKFIALKEIVILNLDERALIQGSISVHYLFWGLYAASHLLQEQALLMRVD